MALPTYRYEVDWDHDLLWANTNSDITSLVRNNKSRKMSIGRSGSSTTTNKSKAGKMSMLLDNRTGIFSSLKTSGALFGKMKSGRRVRVHMASRAALMTSANSEFLSIADNASLSTGDIDFTIATWVYLDDKSALMDLVSKFKASGNQHEFILYYNKTTDRFVWRVNFTGSLLDFTEVSADNLGSPSSGTWYFIVVWHDASANTTNIQVNNGTVDSAAHTTGVFDSTADFVLGGRDGGGSFNHNGRMAPCMFTKEALTVAERTWLYMEGNGRHYSDIGRTGDGSSLKTSLESWWELDEASGTRVDSHGSNDLTDNNTVTDAEGITNYLLWSGRLDRIIPSSVVGRHPEAKFMALGNLASISGGKPRSTRRTDILTNAAIDVLLDSIGWPASSTSARDISTGQTTMKYWFHSVAVGTNTFKEAQKVEDTEIGWFRESERDDLVFEDRHHRLSGSRLTSQRTYADDGTAGAILYQKIPQDDPVSDVYNRIVAEAPVQSLASSAILWTLDATGANSPLIGAGETQRFLAEFPVPGSTTANIGAVWATLIENTDYEANSESDGSGTDLSSSLTITLVKALDLMVISIANNHASLGAYITLLQAQGQAVLEGNKQKMEVFDQDSIDDFGDREWPLSAKFIPNMQELVDHIRYVLSLNKDIGPKMSISYIASADTAHIKEAGIRRLSGLITVESDTATQLGISGERVFVEAIEHSIDEKKHVVTMILSPSDTRTGKVIVLNTGPGLGTGILGF